MIEHTDSNVIPLAKAIVAHRNRLIERDQYLGVAQSAKVADAAQYMERWMVNFAYQRIAQDY